MLLKLLLLLLLSLVFIFLYQKLKRLPSNQHKLSQRLNDMSNLGQNKKAPATPLFKQPFARRYLANIKLQFDVYSDKPTRLKLMLQSIGITALVCTLFIWLTSFVLILAAPMLFIACFTALFMRHKKRWQNQFLEDLPDALEQMARALSAGMSLLQALIETSKQVKDPIKQEFNWILQRLNIGDTATSVFHQAPQRVAILQYQFFCISLLLNQETGGRLAQVLKRQSEQIKAQKRTRQKLFTLTSEPRLTAKVVSAIPLIMFLALFWLNPEQVSFLLNHSKGQQILIYVITSTLAGLLLIQLMIYRAGGR